MISNVVVHIPSVRVTWLLRELDIEFQVRDQKELREPGGLLSPETMAGNPKKAIPLIELMMPMSPEKSHMYESAGILRFVASNASLFPRVPSGKSIRTRASATPFDALEDEPKDLVPTLHNCARMEEILEFEQMFAFASGQLSETLLHIQVIHEFRKSKKEEKYLLDVCRCFFFFPLFSALILPHHTHRREQVEPRAPAPNRAALFPETHEQGGGRSEWVGGVLPPQLWLLHPRHYDGPGAPLEPEVRLSDPVLPRAQRVLYSPVPARGVYCLHPGQGVAQPQVYVLGNEWGLSVRLA